MSSLVKMSLVITPRSYSSLIVLQRRSNNAVLPGPAGPPKPIFTGFLISRPEEAAVKVSMIHLLNVQKRIKRPQRLVFKLQSASRGIGNPIDRGGKQSLSLLLSDRNHS